MRAVAVAVAGLFIVSACGGVDVTESREYASLLTENESLSGDLADTRVELGVSERRLRDLDQRLSDAESQIADVDEQQLAVRSDFADYLTYQFTNAGGLSDARSSCLSEVLVNDDAARAAYLVLLTSTDPGSEETNEAYEALTGTFDECGLEIPAPDGGASSPTPDDLQQAMEDSTRPVEVIGSSLPTLSTPDIDSDVAIGSKAPVLIGEDYDGRSIRIDGAASGPTMVVVLAHWCPHCNAEIPNLNRLRDEGRIPDGVDVVAISSLVNPTAPNFPPDVWLTEVDWTYPVLADGVDLERQVFVGSDALGVSGVPFVVLIDGDGNVAARWAGERDPEETVRLLTSLVGGN